MVIEHFVNRSCSLCGCVLEWLGCRRFLVRALCFSLWRRRRLSGGDGRRGGGLGNETEVVAASFAYGDIASEIDIHLVIKLEGINSGVGDDSGAGVAGEARLRESLEQLRPHRAPVLVREPQRARVRLVVMRTVVGHTVFGVHVKRAVAVANKYGHSERFADGDDSSDRGRKRIGAANDLHPHIDRVVGESDLFHFERVNRERRGRDRLLYLAHPLARHSLGLVARFLVILLVLDDEHILVGARAVETRLARLRAAGCGRDEQVEALATRVGGYVSGVI